MNESKPAEILLVEDNQADAVLIKTCMQKSPIKHHVHIVGDGMEAMAYLRKEGAWQEAVRPDLILLDLNLPRMDGRAVLREIKADLTLQRIPVVILTSSDADQDIDDCYNLQANSYLRKPVDFSEFISVIGAVLRYWFSLVSLPDR